MLSFEYPCLCNEHFRLSALQNNPRLNGPLRSPFDSKSTVAVNEGNSNDPKQIGRSGTLEDTYPPPTPEIEHLHTPEIEHLLPVDPTNFSLEGLPSSSGTADLSLTYPELETGYLLYNGGSFPLSTFDANYDGPPATVLGDSRTDDGIVEEIVTTGIVEEIVTS